jgi:hypothetical protein
MICGNGFNLQLAAGTLVFFAQQARNSEVSRAEQQHARRFWRVTQVLVIEMNLGAPRAGYRGSASNSGPAHAVDDGRIRCQRRN